MGVGVGGGGEKKQWKSQERAKFPAGSWVKLRSHAKRCSTGCTAVQPANEESGEPKVPVRPPFKFWLPLTAESPFWPFKHSTPSVWPETNFVSWSNTGVPVARWAGIQLAGLLGNNGRLRNFQTPARWSGGARWSICRDGCGPEPAG